MVLSSFVPPLDIRVSYWLLFHIWAIYRLSPRLTMFAIHLKEQCMLRRSVPMTLRPFSNILQSDTIPVTNVYRFHPHKETPAMSNPRLLLTFSVPFPPTRVKILSLIH